MDNKSDHAKAPFHLKVLKEQLGKLQEVEGAASLRRIARELRLNPGVLSRLIHNRRPMTLSCGMQLFSRLNIEPSEMKQVLESLIVDATLRRMDELLQSPVVTARPGGAGLDVTRILKTLQEQIGERIEALSSESRPLADVGE